MSIEEVVICLFYFFIVPHCRSSCIPYYFVSDYAREIVTGLICTSNCLNFSTAIYVFDRIRFLTVSTSVLSSRLLYLYYTIILCSVSFVSQNHNIFIDISGHYTIENPFVSFKLVIYSLLIKYSTDFRSSF